MVIERKYFISTAFFLLCTARADAFDARAYMQSVSQARDAYAAKNYSAAASHYAKAAKEAETKSGDNLPLITSLSSQAKCERFAGDLAAAEATLYRALPLTEKRTDGLRGRIFAELAQVQALAKKNSAAEVSFKVACFVFAQSRKNGQPFNKLEGSCLLDYSAFLKEQGRDAEATQMHTRGQALISQ